MIPKRICRAGLARRGGGTILTVILFGPLSGCTGATVGSGVGEARFEHAPYYAGRFVPAEGRSVAYLPVTYQAGTTEESAFEPPADEGSAVHRLVEAMSGHLRSLAKGSHHLVGPLSPPTGIPPDVQFSCEDDELGECAIQDGGGRYGPGMVGMRLAVGRPSGDWTLAASQAMAAAGAEAMLVITLEVGQYWPRQVNFRGSKVLELGTDRTVALPWLTAIDRPISVIQLTGALIGPDGKAIRIGAEGLSGYRTPILVSGFGGQALIRDEDVEALLTERLGESPEGPMVWQAALETLVANLVGR